MKRYRAELGIVLALAVVVLAVVGAWGATTGGLPLQWPAAEAQEQGATNLTGLHVDGVHATATPLVRVNGASGNAGKLLEAAAAGTPVWSVNSSGAVSGKFNSANLMVPSVISTSVGTVITTGVTTNVAIIPAGQAWLIHAVLAHVGVNYDCTGDDCTFVVGDADDADGYLVLADAAMQTADTEGTGWQAGWQGMAAAEIGAYLDDNNNAFIKVASTVPITIVATAAESSGTTMAAGAAEVYTVYTRLW